MLTRAFFIIGLVFSLIFMVGIYVGIVIDDNNYGGYDAKVYQLALFSLVPASIGWIGFGVRKGAFANW